ncbi:MAG: hypothetical protein ACI4S2_13515 [Lachnospiraceae bacterium]
MLSQPDTKLLEALAQVFLVVPLVFTTEKTVGYRKIWNHIPTWFLAGFIYSIWNIYNALVLYYPRYITKMITEEAMHLSWALGGLVMMFVILPSLYKGTIIERYFVFFVFALTDFFARLFRMLGMVILEKFGLWYVIQKDWFFLLFIRLVLQSGPYFLFYFIFRKQFAKYHDWVIKHKKLCSAATILVVGLEISTALMSIDAEHLEKLRLFINPAVLFGTFMGAIYFLKRENRQVYLQKQLLENHYQSIKSQEEQVVSMQSEIGELLKAAEKLEKEKKYSEEELKHYGEELKKLHSKLRRVDYCDNLMLDAVLHNKEKECEEKNIKLDIRMQDISFGGVSDVDIFEVVYGMLEVAIDLVEMQEDKALKTIVISGKNLAGQVVIEVSIPSNTHISGKDIKESRNQYKRLKRKVKVLRGQCIRKIEGETEKIVVGIMCGSAGR